MDALHPYASPIFASSSEIKICPTLIQVGDAERIRDDGLYFASQSMNSDESIFTEVYEDGVHVFQLFSIFDSFANHALERLSAFIKNHMGSRGILVDSRAIKVFNGKSYPVERISDLNGILNDGVEFLVDQKVYIPNASKPLM